MATISAAAQPRIAGGVQPQVVPEDADRIEGEEDHGLSRFFFAACAALILSAMQGVVQRLPGISEWLLGGDYGGHMVTNLAHTHITIVGAGTISLTALIYYAAPKGHRQSALQQVADQPVVLGNANRRVRLLPGDAGDRHVRGGYGTRGWRYEDARDWMGAWHKAPDGDYRRHHGHRLLDLRHQRLHDRRASAQDCERSRPKGPPRRGVPARQVLRW